MSINPTIYLIKHTNSTHSKINLFFPSVKLFFEEAFKYIIILLHYRNFKLFTLKIRYVNLLYSILLLVKQSTISIHLSICFWDHHFVEGYL